MAIDMYQDSEARYLSDSRFRNVVDLLVEIAQQEGYTPGELKQIAFYSALRVEQLSPRPAQLSPRPALAKRPT